MFLKNLNYVERRRKPSDCKCLLRNMRRYGYSSMSTNAPTKKKDDFLTSMNVFLLKRRSVNYNVLKRLYVFVKCKHVKDFVTTNAHFVVSGHTTGPLLFAQPPRK